MAAVVVLASCGSGPEVGPQLPRTAAEATTFSWIEANVLLPRCGGAACHSGNPPAAAPLGLDAGLAYDNLVGRSAEQAPALSQVEPGDPSRSYLLLKMRGTAGGAGGVGTRMPPNDAPLPDEDLAAIDAWIAAGAPND